MQFVDILNDIYDRTSQQQASTVDAAVSRRIKRFVNRWNRKILSSPGMDPLRRVILTQASVVSQATYGIVAQAIRYMTDASTFRKLGQKDLGWYRTNYPDPTQFSGTPLDYVPLGFARIHTRPSAACELFIVSTDAGDVGTAKVDVVRTNGYKRLLSVAMTGIVPVSLGAAIADVIDVEDFYLSVAAIGTVTLTQGSGGTELSRIPIGATYQRFYRYALAPTPSAVVTRTIDAIAELTDLVNDTDEPFPNADFHDLLVDGGVYEEWNTHGKIQDARVLRADMELRIRRLRASILEWSYNDYPRTPTFDESIHLPVV